MDLLLQVAGGELQGQWAKVGQRTLLGSKGWSCLSFAPDIRTEWGRRR